MGGREESQNHRNIEQTRMNEDKEGSTSEKGWPHMTGSECKGK